MSQYYTKLSYQKNENLKILVPLHKLCFTKQKNPTENAISVILSQEPTLLQILRKILHFCKKKTKKNKKLRLVFCV